MHPRVSMITVEELLGVPPGYPPWRVADMARRARALPTWLSTAYARGIPLSPAAQEVLDREWRRVETLHGIAEAMAAAHRVTVLKGVRIAGHLPKGMLRQSGDVDLVAADEEALWLCVQDLIERFDAVPQGVSVMTGTDIHYGVALKWPASEAFLDKPMGADVTTCAFAGNFAGVPIRTAPLDDDDLCSIFAVAEERFQRKYRLKDLLDLLALAEAAEDRFGGELLTLIPRYAKEVCLAPELLQLIGKADGWVPVSPLWEAIAAALEPIAKDEKAARKSGGRAMHRLEFGLPISPITSTRGMAERILRDGGDLLKTPIGTCLLVDSPVVDADEIAAALEFLRRGGPAITCSGEAA
jgi:hypothetical protein